MANWGASKCSSVTNRERKCADTVGKVLVLWACHFQCRNLNILNKIHGSNFFKQHSETVTVWNYRNADCQFKENKFIVLFVVNFDTLSFPMALTSVYSIRCLPATCPLLGHAEAAPPPPLRCGYVHPSPGRFLDGNWSRRSLGPRSRWLGWRLIASPAYANAGEPSPVCPVTI